MKEIKSYVDSNKDRFLNELFELIRIPSISAIANAKDDMHKAAESIRQSLLNAGADHAEHDGRVVGFMIYELHKTRLHILNFAVHPDFQRRQVGGQMMQKLVGKLSQQRRSRIVLEVRETNLAAQLFFREGGFRAVSVLRDFYDDTTEDAYLMQFLHRPAVPELVPVNRITRLAG